MYMLLHVVMLIAFPHLLTGKLGPNFANRQSRSAVVEFSYF